MKQGKTGGKSGGKAETRGKKKNEKEPSPEAKDKDKDKSDKDKKEDKEKLKEFRIDLAGSRAAWWRCPSSLRSSVPIWQPRGLSTIPPGPFRGSPGRFRERRPQPTFTI